MIRTTLFPHTFRQIFSLSNDDIANVFEQVSDLLEAKGDDYYRIRAYRKGAEAIRAQVHSVVALFEADGTDGLKQIPYIGRRLAQAIKELAETGDLRLLQRLSIDVSPEDLFTTLPGIGQVLARRLYRGLGLRSLAELAQAAQAGVLAQVPGFGPERIEQLKDTLAALPPEKVVPRQTFRVPAIVSDSRTSELPIENSPAVELLLAVDAQYQYLAKAGQLRMVTPRRFNPEAKPWLPVMHLKKEGWTFKVLYSNTARAHELGKTHDWVVVNYERDAEAGQPGSQQKGQQKGQQRGQCTVVTETQGAKRGQRVVRGAVVVAA